MSESAGFILIVVGGFMQGTYYLGLKWTNPWKWENIWLTYAVLALVVMPVIVAVATVPQFGGAWSLAPSGALAKVFLYGAGWGIGSVLSGLGVDRVGLAMGVSILIGIAAALGALIPLAVDTPELMLKPKGLVIILSVIVLLVGVTLVGIAGKKRDASRTGPSPAGQKGSFKVGLLICVFSGIFSCMLNLAFSFSKPVAQAAVLAGASQGGAQNFVWMIALGGGFIANAVYTCFLLGRNRTWKNFTMPKSSRVALIGLVMALLWYWGIILYGRGAGIMGSLGTVAGWPIFMATMIIISTIWGFGTGEWKGSSSQAKWYMLAGLVVLIVASGISGFANNMR
ncbi:MAG: L-rhamnose/proton symporter RhaT [Terriglobia bacterium]